ncbi:ABC transporter substrate-binding protein [Christiangramia portivictoriae]|uniref:ABC transporter substrate-binding protein n=1 Tax=Christiangramia portivictoriae TaxID=326069 RepID=UPI000420888A|nr:ABC transporter substrate-binding protein [Christiangramia portivictoriae]
MKQFIFIILCIVLISCKDNSSRQETINQSPETTSIKYAEGFSIKSYDNYKILEVATPWPGANEAFRYVLHQSGATIPDSIDFDEKLEIPVRNIVVTSTTHIPALEALGLENKLTGFPGTRYISSEKTRKLIDSGRVQELGQNENINTEILIDLSPDVVVGFAIDASNKSLETIKKTGIPVLYNGDWTEKTPLGKAEWIRFFGVLFDKNEDAEEIFEGIETSYLQAKKLAAESKEKPVVIAGSMYNDKWYVPFGNSWQAQFIEDANANYLYADTEGEGSLALSFESVLDKAGNADFWISSGQFESYAQLAESSGHYEKFRAVQQKEAYTVSLSKGATGGVLFYELGPQRPDLILKDLISIFHPDLLPEHKNVFFKPLN